MIKNVFPFELEESWSNQLEDKLCEPYLVELAAFLNSQRNKGFEIYPPDQLIFNAFFQTPYNKVRVVIMGQDPYHGPGQAHGLSFSVSKEVTPPPSLKNIYKELQEDLGIPPANHGCLLRWAQQGVLLLNATLSVEKGKPKSHYGLGWEKFTDEVIIQLSRREAPLVFILWGKSAQEKCTHLLKNCSKEHHLILSSPHPSPFSARTGFFGSRPFSKINHFFDSKGLSPIDWSL